MNAFRRCGYYYKQNNNHCRQLVVLLQNSMHERSPTKMKNQPCTARLVRLYGLLVVVVASLVEADYQLQVTVHSFSLLRNRCAMCLQGSTPTEMEMDQCCDYDAMQPPHESSDGSCIPQCDVYFSYCQGRPLGTAINSTNCPNNDFFQSTIPIYNANETRISFGDRVFGTLNPVTFNGTQISWEGIQFYMEFKDRDFTSGNPDDLIDTLAVDVNIPVGASVSRTTYTGTFNNTQVELSFRVVCAENYYGPDCKRFCNDSSCPCDSGYTGVFCETNINDCARVNCSGHGHCEDGIDFFLCQCDVGYTGEFCEIDTDYCEGVNCSENGQCIQNISSFFCLCNSGFTGELCETSTNKCPDRDCGQNGRCVVGLDSYTCGCNTGFTGEGCEQRIDVCVDVTCSGNGRCEESENGMKMFTCVCDSGYTGTVCEMNIDDCVGVNCSANSHCVDEINSFKCVCDSGYSGPLCDDRSNDNFSLIGPVVGGILGTVVFVLIVLVTVVLVVLLLRRKGTHKGLSDTAVHNGFTDDSSITESTMPLVSSKPSMGHSTIDRDFQNPLYGGGELPDNVYDQTENVYDVTVHSEVHKAQAGGPMMENCLTTKLKDESVYDGDPNQTLRNFKNPVYGDRVDAPTCEEDHAKLKTLKNVKNPIYGNDNDTPGQNSAPQRPHEYADVGPVYASLENQHDRAERYASKAAAEFKITIEGGSAVGVDMATDNRQYEDVV